MSHNDELRILAEMGTFTQGDFAAAVECSSAWASMVFEQLQREKVIERVRVGKSWLYALTARGKARVSRMPAIDPDEMCLPLSFEGVTPCDCMNDEPPIVISSIVGLINNGASQVFEDNQYCRTCGMWLCSTRYTETPF